VWNKSLFPLPIWENGLGAHTLGIWIAYSSNQGGVGNDGVIDIIYVVMH